MSPIPSTRLSDTQLRPMSTPPTVVLVDDDLSVRRALPRLLRSAGYQTRTFCSAQEILESGLAIDAACLILDLHLGRASGFDLLERLRATGVRAPVVFITAFDDESARERARAAGAIAYLRKPFDATTLLEAIASALPDGRAAAGGP